MIVFWQLSGAEQEGLRSQVTDHVRLYVFLAQVLPFKDADLENQYVFARYLRRLLPGDKPELSLAVQQNIDMESYRVQQTASGKIALRDADPALEASAE